MGLRRVALAFSAVLVGVSCAAPSKQDGGSSSRHPSFATTTESLVTSTEISSVTSASPVTTSISVPPEPTVLVGPAPTSPDELPGVSDLPDNIALSSLGVHGQIRATAFGPSGDFGWGLSFYTGIWDHFNARPPAEVLTANGTWLIPDNWRYSETLCPEGSTAQKSLSARGPSYREVFQSIDGGVGYWSQTRFPSKHPKFRINGNTDCYNTTTSNPGWVWRSNDEVIPGLIQLSNRILVPPDGITFDSSNGSLLGTAWMALPLSDPYDRNGVVIGDKSWTLFVEAANFRGPVAYWAPEAWSRITVDHSPAHFRGLDHREIDTQYRLFASQLTVPSLGTVVEGQNWSRIPELRFPVDPRGRTVFHQDVTFYARDAIFEQVAAAKKGAPLATAFDDSASMHAPLQTHRWELNLGELQVVGLEKFVRLADWDSENKEGWGWGLQWLDDSGVFPSYFRLQGKEWLAVEDSKAPSEIVSEDLGFPSATRRAGYAPPLAEGPAPQVQQVQLNDGSVVRYTWYRFVDQPALAALGLDPDQKSALQSLVEQIHREWDSNAEFMKPPSEGALVKIQDEVIVQPPVNGEVGWVPVVISQTAAD